MFKQRESLAQSHLDANTLAAFVQLKLPAKQRKSALIHLADCERCRECLALTAEIVGRERHLLPHAHDIWPRTRATAAVAVALFVLFLLPVHLAVHHTGAIPRAAIPTFTPKQNLARSETPHADTVFSHPPSARPERGRHAPAPRIGPQHVRPDFLASVPAWIELLPVTLAGIEPRPDHVVIQTPLGERWFTLAGIWEREKR